MSKFCRRILSLTLCVALLVACVSGLSLTSGAAAPATPDFPYAKVDFSDGEIHLTNFKLRYNHMAGFVTKAKNNNLSLPTETVNEYGLDTPDGTSYGMLMYQQNNGFGLILGDIGLTGEDVAVTVEYYMPSTVVQNATRYNLKFGKDSKVDYTLNYSGNGSNTNNAPLTADRWNTATFIVSGAQAKALASSTEDERRIDTNCWNYNNNGYFFTQNNAFALNSGWGGDYYYIRSITVMAASHLQPADPGYDYYDFCSQVAENPLYSQYTKAEQVGMTWSLNIKTDNTTEGHGTVGANGLTMEDNYLYFDTARARNKSHVAVHLIFAKGTSGDFKMEYNADTAKNPDYTGNINFKPVTTTIDNDEAWFYLSDADFAKKANAGSLRLGIAGKTLRRIEVHVLADVTGYTATLQDDIRLNFSLALGQPVTSDPAATVRVTGAEVNATYSIADLTETNGVYTVPVAMAAKHMSDDVTLTVSGANFAPYTHTYSVADYAAAILENSDNNADYTKAADLTRAMLNYGAAAQAYFNYNTTALANAALTDEQKDLSAVTTETLAAYKDQNKRVTNDGVSFIGANLTLLSKTTLRLFFTANDVTDLTVTCGTTTLPLHADEANGRYYVEVANITPERLADDMAIQVTRGDTTLMTVTYNVMAYGYNVLRQTDSRYDNLKQVVRALCLYQKAAATYTA